MSEEFSPQMENEKSRPLPEGQILYKHAFREHHIGDEVHNRRLATDDAYMEKHFGDKGLILADLGDSRALLKEGPYAPVDAMVMHKAPGPEGLSGMSIEEIQRSLHVVDTVRQELIQTFPDQEILLGVHGGSSQSVGILHIHITGIKGEFLPEPESYIKATYPEGYMKVKGSEVDSHELDLLKDSLNVLEPSLQVAKEDAVLKVKLQPGDLASDENARLIKIIAEQLELARRGLLSPSEEDPSDKEWGSALSINEDNEIVMAIRPVKVGMLEVNGMLLQREDSPSPLLRPLYDHATTEAMRIACERAKAKLEAEGL